MAESVALAGLDKLTSLCKRRGFVFQSSEIYGGLASTWDYGPLGVEIKRHVKEAWWRAMVLERDDVVGLDSAIMMHPETWRASGHVESFTDPLVECKACHQRWRDDQLDGRACPACGGELTQPRMFNLMFKTFMGPVEEDANVVYLRPETAQGIFVNFDNVLNAARKKLPFGIAQIGKAFRNEITTGNFIFRTREFEMMEIEYFVPPRRRREVARAMDPGVSRLVHRPGRRAEPSPRPRARGRRAVPLLQGDPRRRVPISLGLGGDPGRRQPHGLRPEGPLRQERRVSDLLRRRVGP